MVILWMRTAIYIAKKCIDARGTNCRKDVFRNLYRSGGRGAFLHACLHPPDKKEYPWYHLKRQWNIPKSGAGEPAIGYISNGFYSRLLST